MRLSHSLLGEPLDVTVDTSSLEMQEARLQSSTVYEALGLF